MRHHPALLTILALGAAGLSLPAAAQDDATPALSPADSEAYAITENFQFGCDPGRWAKVPDSESRIEHDPAPLIGRASFFAQDEGFFLVLDQYDDDGSRHCVVLTRRGGVPAAGRYAVGRVSASLMEQRASRGEDEPFYGMFGLRNARVASILVVDSGFVLIDASGPERMGGSFELAGFAIDGARRTDGMIRRGAFTAVKVEK